MCVKETHVYIHAERVWNMFQKDLYMYKKCTYIYVKET